MKDMPDTKISDMPPAVTVHGDDLIVIVQGGDDLKATTAQIMFSPDGNDKEFGNNDGEILISNFGSFVFQIGNEWFVNFLLTGFQLSVDAIGRVQWDCLSFNFSLSGGERVNILPGQSVYVSYVTLVSAGVWAVGPPLDLATGQDRIAAALAGLLGFPIP